MRTLIKYLVATLITGLILSLPVRSQVRGVEMTAHNELARDIYRQLIEINTTDTELGDNTRAAEAMAARLLAAGFPEADVRVLEPHPRKGNLVARYRGTGEKEPLLLLAHLDVVEARPEEWSVDPFILLERDGYFYGRGTLDDKAMAAIWIAILIRLRQEGYMPNRDLIVALTADEEGGGYNGVEYLLENHRELIDAEFCLNEGGGGQIKDGMRLFNAVQATEKVYQSYRLEVTHPGGHSSRPTHDNAIYYLSEGLARLAKHEFPVHLNETTRQYFEKMSGLHAGQLAADMKAVTMNPPDRRALARLSASPYENALMRTTCVATRLDAGHADNALPQTARAVVNCRILPGESPIQVRAELVRVLSNSRISVTPLGEAQASPASPLKPEIMGPIERATSEMWPGVVVVPVMSTGATDGLYLRNAGIPTYGVSGLFSDIGDNRAHGSDERLGVRHFYEAREFLYRLIKAFSS